MPFTYREAVDALERALTFGIEPSLDGIRALTEALGRPQDVVRFVQVTGTNGKTSVTRMVAALLHAHGHRTLAYTSPHLESYTERMEIDGAPVREATFAAAVEAAVSASAGLGLALTEFELLTGAALWLAREERCAWAVLEVGMGGRWDATSVVTPAVAVVTGVGLDHTDRLGRTVEEIAADKAHIIKRGSKAVFGPGTPAVRDVLDRRAADVGAPVTDVGPDGSGAAWTFAVERAPEGPAGCTTVTVLGPSAAYADLEVRAPAYQAPNAATAVAAATAALGHALDPRATRAALAGLAYPGRFEVVSASPPVVLDGAHNPQAAAVLASAIGEAWPEAADRPLALIGVLADKDAEGIVRALAPVVRGFVCTSPDSPRALAASALADVVAGLTGVRLDAVALSDVTREWALRQAGSAGGLVVTGSLYTVGQLRHRLRGPSDATGR